MKPALTAAEARGSQAHPVVRCVVNGEDARSHKNNVQELAAKRTVASRGKAKNLPPYVVVCNSYRGLIRYGVKLTIAGVKGQTRVGSSYVDPESASNAAKITLEIAHFDRATGRLVVDEDKAAAFAARSPTRCRTYRPRSTTYIESDTLDVVSLIISKRAPRNGKRSAVSGATRGRTPALAGCASKSATGGARKAAAKKQKTRGANKRAAAAEASSQPVKRHAKPPTKFSFAGAHLEGSAGGVGRGGMYGGQRQYSPQSAMLSIPAMQQQHMLTYQRHFAAAAQASAAAQANAMRLHPNGLSYNNGLGGSGQNSASLFGSSLPSPRAGLNWFGPSPSAAYSPRHNGHGQSTASGVATTASAPPRVPSPAQREAASRAAAAESIGNLFASGAGSATVRHNGSGPALEKSKLLQRRIGGGAAGLAVAVDAPPRAAPSKRSPLDSLLWRGPLDSLNSTRTDSGSPTTGECALFTARNSYICSMRILLTVVSCSPSHRWQCKTRRDLLADSAPHESPRLVGSARAAAVHECEGRHARRIKLVRGRRRHRGVRNCGSCRVRKCMERESERGDGGSCASRLPPTFHANPSQNELYYVLLSPMISGRRGEWRARRLCGGWHHPDWRSGRRPEQCRGVQQHQHRS